MQRLSKREIFERIFRSPVIFGLKNPRYLDEYDLKNFDVIFLLAGNIATLDDEIKTAKEKCDLVMVHIDLIDGLAPRPAAVDYVARHTAADGIISTRPKLLVRASELGLFTILRAFLLDSMALENIKNNVRQCDPDMIEILPGIVCDNYRDIHERSRKPIIAGGLIRHQEDALAAFRAGVSAVSSSTLELGELNPILQATLKKITSRKDQGGDAET